MAGRRPLWTTRQSGTQLCLVVREGAARGKQQSVLEQQRRVSRERSVEADRDRLVDGAAAPFLSIPPR